MTGNPEPAVNKNIYIGTFFIALSTLMYEILLTRIFSVTMGYHFAFLAVSLAMFGMTVGAIIVYLFPQKFPQEKINDVLAKNTLYFSLTTILSFLLHLFIPFTHEVSAGAVLITVFTYAEISVPFVFSGICISLLLSRFPKHVNKLYAADLTGASLGCVIVVLVLNISGGPTGVFVTAFFTAVGALFFLKNPETSTKFRKTAVAYILIVAMFSVINTILVQNNHPLVRIYYIQGVWQEKPLWEKWNSFSRLSISGDSTAHEVPFGWGLSSKYDRSKKIRQVMLNIDAHSTTVLTQFSGDTSKLGHLKYDIDNLVHYLRPNSDVLVVGSGAGRDVLSSFAFGQKSVLGIEINKDMIWAINNEFGNFTGHLDKYPNVELVGDEARSYIQRLDKKFDIIQISVLDNWYASASGTFVFTENALYTIESWKVLLDHLNPDGILSVTRFYRSTPMEHYRLVNITADAMNSIGINDLRSHIMLLKCQQQERIEDRSGTGTVLISKKPFTKTDEFLIDSLSKEFDFEKILTPSSVSDSVFALLASNSSAKKELVDNFPIDITSSTDDKPFFFQYMKFTDIIHPEFQEKWDLAFNAKAVFILLAIAGAMILLSLLCVIIPLKITSGKVNTGGSAPFFIFFMAIGLGFMFIEISQIQRLNIFLGHPTYSLAAALFTLLLSSGIGSYFSGGGSPNVKGFYIRFIFLLAALVLFGIFTPHIIAACREYSTITRILVSAAILFPLGLFMGMAFPVGMRIASQKSPQITPWLWGINGVMSVLATVLAVIIAMNYGISASYWSGTLCYLIAAVSFISLSKKVNV